MSGSLIGGAAFNYRITDAGRERASLFLANNHYVGVAPVPLQQYRSYMRRLPAGRRERRRRPSGSAARIRHLVLKDRVLDQLGPAVRAGRSLFIYGPAGNGKTVIAQGIRKLLDGEIAIPHALEVEGAIIRFFDPVNHEPLAMPEEGTTGFDRGSVSDGRWVRCRRPMLMVGGELTLEGLELSYSTSAGFYRAPVQALANGGVLVIDDFGRQHCSPRDLLNRWIVPLEMGSDFLTLHTGLKFEIPFATLVVFATNVQAGGTGGRSVPAADPVQGVRRKPEPRGVRAHLRDLLRAGWRRFRTGAGRRDPAGYFQPRGIALRGCQPRDLVNQALAMAEYRGHGRRLTADLLEAACDSYFVDDREHAPEYA